MSALNSLINIDLDEKHDIFLYCRFDSTKKLHVTLLDVNECKAFSGYATDINLRSQAASINMIYSDFFSISIKALTGSEVNETKFLYSLDKNCENFAFKWKSVDLYETIISIGNIEVIETDYGSMVKNVFFMLSKELSHLNLKVSNIENQLENVKKERESAVRLATEITDMKEQLEKELYSKFILVLNQKKEKIRSLKGHNNSSLTSNITSTKIKTSRHKKLHQISDSSDEAMSDMDEGNIAGPSTGKHNISLPYLDDERPILSSPSKRRIRQKIVTDKKVNSQENKKKEVFNMVMESESEDELMLNL